MFLAISFVIVVIIIATIYGIKEIKDFNDGNCECGKRYKSFTMDSQGGIGWKCEGCDKHMWTSWVNAKNIK